MASLPDGFSEKIARAIVERVRKGDTEIVAANAAGIGESYLLRWKKRGRQAGRGGPFRKFFVALRAARAQYISEELAYIRKTRHWTARAWILERTNHEEFGRKERGSVRHAGAVTVRIVRGDYPETETNGNGETDETEEAP